MALMLNIWFCSKQAPLDPSEGGTEKFNILIGLSSLPEDIPPSGNTLISALVLDQDNKAVAGQQIDFSASTGSVVPAFAITDSSGIAFTTFTAPLQSQEVTVTGRFGTTQSQFVKIQVKSASPQSVNIRLDSGNILADGLSGTAIETTWKTEAGKPLKGIEVSFTSNLGTIENSANTDSFGVARAYFTSPALRSDALAIVTASGHDLESTAQIFLRGLQFSLFISPNNLLADGRSQSEVTAILKETTSNVAVAGGVITFGADLGTIPNAVTTNSEGVARTFLTSTSETGLSTITAHFGNQITESGQVNISESMATTLTVSVEPTVLLADNRSTALITAVVSDQTNGPISDGTLVNFEIIAGTGTIEATKSTVDGVAVSQLTSSTVPDTAVIAVRVNDLRDTTSVRYIVGDAAIITVVSDSSTLAADGKTSTKITATVSDIAGNPVVDGTLVSFTTDIGDVNPYAQTVGGIAQVQFSSSETGTATIRASVDLVFDTLTIELRPGPPNSVLLTFDPNFLGVKDSGRNQTLTVTALVIDSKNNPVVDGTFIRFSIFASPGGGELLSSTGPTPTLNGSAQVSLNSGNRSGSVRVMAEVTDSLGIAAVPDVRAISTEIIIFAGPPYIENINDASSSHLSVGVTPLNVYGWGIVNNIARVTAVVGDKFNNPVPAGTAVFFTTTGGVIATYQGFTDDEGVAVVNIHTAQPYPTIDRFYTLKDPNRDLASFTHNTDSIPGPIPDFDLSEVVNSRGGLVENDGITRVLATTEGVDSTGASARAWDVTGLVFSGPIDQFIVTQNTTSIDVGESATISFTIYDVNGNPIVPGSEIAISVTAGQISWGNLSTSDPGITHYSVLLTNDLDPTDPDARETSTTVSISVTSPNGNMPGSSAPIRLTLN